MTSPLPDHSARQLTPTLQARPSGITDPTTYKLPPSFTVCILGASRGIGAAIAYAYATAGAGSLVLTGRDISALEKVAAEARRRASNSHLQVLTVPCDVSVSSSVAAIATLIRDKVGRLDVVVVNAGFSGTIETRVTEGNPEQFQRIMDTQVIGAYLAAHHLVPILLDTKDGARAFVAVGGLGAWIVEGPVAHVAHSVSKLAQARILEMMANDFREEGLLCATVNPGLVETDTSKAMPMEFHDALTDDPGLCGGFLVWLTHTREDRMWLSGRFLSANWDVEELLSMKAAIIEKDLLKARIAVS